MEEDCLICFTPKINIIICKLPCGHELCLHCLFKVPKYICHICRQDYKDMVPQNMNEKKEVKCFEEFDRF